MFDKLVDVLLEFIGYFKFWRVIPVNKVGVRLRFGVKPIELKPGLHWVWPFEIDNVKTCVVKPEVAATECIHITTTDMKTLTISPFIKYEVTDAIAWMYGANGGDSNLYSYVRFCTSDVITEGTMEDSMKKPVWTKIKGKIKDKTDDLGIKVIDFGLIDLALSRIYVTSL
jgi:regulator of protease activity HflC (stomatin/prohibitin superfamily)